MCAIAGYLGLDVISDETVEKCFALMHRRGPNACGKYRHTFGKQNVLLLHTRLSIIDLDERANQPFINGNNAFVVNGELYNYQELKGSIGDYDLKTTCDSEVFFAHLQQEDITAALDKCEGMWAFAYYSEESGVLTLSRDRFGEKPLYIHRDDKGGIYFASEIKVLSELCAKPFTVNNNHLMRYIINSSKSLYKTRDNFFNEVRELPGGCNLEFTLEGGEKTYRYWNPNLEIEREMSFEEAVAGTREKLFRSMQMRLRSDVPLAFCMSGGIDSNALICTAKKIFGYDVHGFTIANADARYSEMDMVSHVVDELGLKHTRVTPDSGHFLGNLRKLVEYHDAPVYTISYYIHWLLMKAIHEQGYKITISGTAADEMFSGYYDHHALYLHAMQDDPQRYKEALSEWNQFIKPIVRNPVLQDPEVFVKNPDQRGHIYLDTDKFKKWLGTDWHEDFIEEKYHNTLMRNRMLNELFNEITPVILHEDDLSAMYFSIENRSPFLDRELFEFSLQIPTRHLVKDGMAKAVLREAMRGIVPQRVLDNREKIGYNASLFELLDGANRQEMVDFLNTNPGFYDAAAINEIFKSDNLSNSYNKFLFSLINSKLFIEANNG